MSRASSPNSSTFAARPLTTASVTWGVGWREVQVFTPPGTGGAGVGCEAQVATQEISTPVFRPGRRGYRYRSSGQRRDLLRRRNRLSGHGHIKSSATYWERRKEIPFAYRDRVATNSTFHTMNKRLSSVMIPVAVMAFVLFGCISADKRVLVFSLTEGFRHASIADGHAAIAALGEEHGFVVDSTENPATFNDESLASYDVVIFMNTTGDVLDDAQQIAFQRFIQKGGGYVGIHAASDTEYGWPWYGQLVGGYFVSHPRIQEADLLVDPSHASTAHLPSTWTRTDEWYNLRMVNSDVQVLISIDETSYDVGEDFTDGTTHPMAWYHEFDGGRAFYTGLGHTAESWSEEAFLTHLKGGIEWVMKGARARS